LPNDIKKTLTIRRTPPMPLTTFLKRIRVVFIALAISFLANYGISVAAFSSTGTSVVSELDGGIINGVPRPKAESDGGIINGVPRPRGESDSGIINGVPRP